MSNLSDDATKLPQGSALVRWVKAVVSKFAHDDGLQGLDRTEFAQIANDLNISPSDLYAISTGGNMPAGLLKKRMAMFGLSPEVLQKQHPDVLRDLERVCATCSSTKRCSREFAQSEPDANFSSFCPNTESLEALEHERLTIEKRALLPIGPACC